MEKSRQDKKIGKNLKLKVREKFVPLAVVIIVVLGTLFLLRPIANNVLEKRQFIKKEQTKFQSLQEKLRLLQTTNEADLEEQVKAIEKVFPSYRPALNLLAALSRLSQEEKVILSAITLSPGEIEELKTEKEEIDETSRKQVTIPPLQDFFLGFSVEGNLQQTSAFISRLEKTAPLMKIEELGLRVVSQSQEETFSLEKVKVDLKVRVFYQKPPETLGAIERALSTLTPKESELLEVLSGYMTYETIKPEIPTGKTDLFNPLFNY